MSEDLEVLLRQGKRAYHKLDPVAMAEWYDTLEDGTPNKLAVEQYFRYLIKRKQQHEKRLLRVNHRQGPRHTKPKRRT